MTLKFAAFWLDEKQTCFTLLKNPNSSFCLGVFFVNFINLHVKFLSKFIKFTVRKIRRKVLNLGSKFNAAARYNDLSSPRREPRQTQPLNLQKYLCFEMFS